MQCPFCGNDSSVTETRVSPDGVRRRRVCTSCKRRFTTYERVGLLGMKVVKRDGRTEPFDLEKLHAALARITRHRPGWKPEDLRRVVRDVGVTLSGAKIVSWSEIAQLVIDRLAAIDPISAQRLRVNYLDDDGKLRLDEPAPAADRPAPQLGLFIGDDAE